jgi:hypothetical protein
VEQAVIWLHARTISPRILLVYNNIVTDYDLYRISGIVAETEVFVLASEASFSTPVMSCLVRRFGKKLSGLNLHEYDMSNQVLRDLRRLTGLEALWIAVGMECTIEEVAVTLGALPRLRTLKLHNRMKNLTVEQAAMLGHSCRELTSLSLVSILFIPDSTNLTEGMLAMGRPWELEYQFRTLAPFLKKLQTLSLSIGISPDSMRALAQHYRHLRYLTFFHTPTIPAFATSQTEAARYAPHVRYLDMSRAESAEDPIVVSVARQCRELLDLRAQYFAELAAAGAAVENEPGPVVFLELRVNSPLLPQSALRILQDRNPGVRIFLAS